MIIHEIAMEFQQLSHDKQYLCFLAHKTKYHCFPSPIYTLYLKEKLISFQIKTIIERNSNCIMVLEKFVVEFSRRNEEDQRLLCDWYQRDLVMDNFDDWYPNPLIGYVHLRSFKWWISVEESPIASQVIHWKRINNEELVICKLFSRGAKFIHPSLWTLANYEHIGGYPLYQKEKWVSNWRTKE